MPMGQLVCAFCELGLGKTYVNEIIVGTYD